MSHEEAVSVVLQRLGRVKYLRRFLGAASLRGTRCFPWPGPWRRFDQDGPAENKFQKVSAPGYFFGRRRPRVVALSKDHYAFSVSLNRYAQDTPLAPADKRVGKPKNSGQVQRDLLLIEGKLPQDFVTQGWQSSAVKTGCGGRQL